MSATIDEIPPALLDVELERIGASSAFRRSPQQYRLLRYLVATTRAGRGARLKESAIAIDVIGRAANDVTRDDDTSVRVTMRRLRQRLARYYADEGAWAAIEIDVPVGSYQPRFLRRTQAAGPKLPSIAVLPFRNFTGDAALDPYCEGLTEEITDALAQLAGVRVTSRTSAFRFRDGASDVRLAGRALGVATLLEGSVQRCDGALRVVSQWVRTRDAFHVWSFGLDAQAGEDDEAVKARVAREVVAGLHRRLREADPAARGSALPPALRRSIVGRAQALYNDARYVMRNQTGDGYRRGIELLRRAIAEDATFAVALCALACGLLNLIGLTFEPADALLDEARNLLARALALDPQLGEAHAALGFVAFAFEHDWARAERCHLRAIRCSPSLCYAHSTYAWGLMLNGRFRDADAEYRFARDLDPLDLKMRAHHALLALYAGDDARAIDELTGILDLEPHYVIAEALLATAHLWRGDLTRAAAGFEALRAAHPAFGIGEIGLAQVDAEVGRADSARARIAQLLGNGRGRHLPPYQAAMVFARLGAADEALAWLDRAGRERDMNFVCAPFDRSFTRLHDDSRFADLLAGHGIAPLWRSLNA